ncbi:Xaa-Pro peptidase family protein [Corynebacterium sp.]|uniref:M24 family metallopeptidase n=1 Tax=Corynebacterium sp. TaxID=1720 RepID=UPI0026485DFB|nr:Xaa-Pro peptidase family protein [Corynebacterium sp.]MDN6136740.1 Xaa-Pro peptidase family protein [Corynebacterium sp.]MDN6736960.1 Xaa-Pro peptidase family protein [Corynebacterium sp.]
MADMSLLTTFAPEVYAQRLERAQEITKAAGIDAVVVATGEDFFYLVGSTLSSHERLTALIIPAEGTPQLFAPGTDILDLNLSPVPQLDVQVHGWNDGDDIYGQVADAIGRDASKVAATAALTADHLFQLQGLISAEWVLANTALAELFSSKDPAEIDELCKAAQAIDRVHAEVPELLQPGRTEREVADDLEALILKEHVSVDFVIVGSMENGANPHHSFSDRVINAGDPVVVDIGGTLASGYHSDCTRTYVAGGDITKAPEDFLAAYKVLQDAQMASLQFAKPGRTAEEIDASSRTPISEAGYGEYFTHRLGHGIGLSGHEEPFIIAGNDLVIQESMAFSIEPGIYMTGKWGMRIEDIVTTTKDGIESLNQGPRELR